MRSIRLLAMLAVSAFALALPAPAREAKPVPEEIDAKGQPKDLKAGLSARYVIWYDKDEWHLRVTTAGDLTAFNGVIEPVDGKITSVRLIATNPRLPAPPALKTETASFAVNLKVGGKGIMNGMDLQLADSATALKFTLKVDDKAAPEQIFIGPQGKHPKEATFYLPAKPGK